MLEIRDISLDFKIVCDKSLVNSCPNISFGGYTMVFAGKEIYFDGDKYDAGKWCDREIFGLDVWDISLSWMVREHCSVLQLMTTLTSTRLTLRIFQHIAFLARCSQITTLPQTKAYMTARFFV